MAERTVLLDATRAVTEAHLTLICVTWSRRVKWRRAWGARSRCAGTGAPGRSESKIAKGNEPAFFTLHDFCSSSLAQPKTLFNDPLAAGF